MLHDCGAAYPLRHCGCGCRFLGSAIPQHPHCPTGVPAGRVPPRSCSSGSAGYVSTGSSSLSTMSLTSASSISQILAISVMVRPRSAILVTAEAPHSAWTPCGHEATAINPAIIADRTSKVAIASFSAASEGALQTRQRLLPSYADKPAHSFRRGDGGKG
jgi:hypothetical protein